MNVFGRRGALAHGFRSGVSTLALVAMLVATAIPAKAQQLLGDPPDASAAFFKLENTYFVGDHLVSFDPATGTGVLEWKRQGRRATYSFLKVDKGIGPDRQNEEFPTEYDENPQTPFAVEFVTPRTIRLRMNTVVGPMRDEPSLMLVGAPPKDNSWKVEQNDKSITYKSTYGSLTIVKNPWEIQIRDAAGKVLTTTQNKGELASFSSPVPFSFVRRQRDMGRQVAAAFQLAPDEKIFGTGESFTRLDKRGQKINLFTRDAMGVQTGMMYKPIPFYLSNKGYGVFMHTSAPITMDVGQSYDQTNVLYIDDDKLDLFVFLGEPKDILSEYTALTGRSPVPPLWSFGFWMSRITYKSEDEVRAVAAKLREYKVPADVIHLDTGWFETDWRCDYKFSPSRFKDPAKMLSDLKQQGFHISLWQLPYFGPKNTLYREIVDSGYAVRNLGGRDVNEDATLDFSNPATVKWYQNLIAGLLKLGVGAIKVDFGEGAPYDGLYASGKTGHFEHNLYPLRYNKTVADITKEVTGDSIIWARAAWAGSQRYPLHWGGDAENTDSAMAATLRAGLSFGLSGFTYWSHDAGGFVNRAPRDLYRRWLAFGVLTSHTRAHGAPPREPWEYDDALVEDFRRAIGLKYTLMPYIYAQAKDASSKGHPMLRTLFFEYPNDPGSWLVEDEYMFGSDLLVAPMFEEAASRRVYLPPGTWIDYQTGKVYPGAQWHEMTPGQIPVVLLVRDHAVIPHIGLAQSTTQMDWKQIELRSFSTDGAASTGLFSLPNGTVQKLTVSKSKKALALESDPLAGQVQWKVTSAEVRR